jgi:hypothetical protein
MRPTLPPFSLGAIFVRLLRLGLAVSLAAGAGVTLADAASVGFWLAGNAEASTLPLLAPITSVGRKAWDCTPELAATTPHVALDLGSP